VFLRISGRLHYLWRAVDQDSDVLDILVQSRRNKKAAKKFFRKLLKGLRYVPRTIITDKLKSYSRGQDRSDAECRSLPGQVAEQSRREFASADQIAREGDEAVQVSEPGAAFSLSLRDHHLALPSGETSVPS